MKPMRTYLALGDSYTIGESVPPTENFPNQLVELLRSQGDPIASSRIIAKTGWTTDELMEAIETAEGTEPIPTDHDLVTLLIGVNNQYRGRSADEFDVQFCGLLTRAIQYAGGDPARVRVLSIPDWGVTPFASERDRDQIAREIDAFNDRIKHRCGELHVPYIYITDLTREAPTQPDLLTHDGLHPSGKDYKRWATRILSSLKSS